MEGGIDTGKDNRAKVRRPDLSRHLVAVQEEQRLRLSRELHDVAGHKLTGPCFWEISGLAWSGRGAIARVEVSTDGGETWTDAELQGPVLPIALTRFRLPWTWDGNPARLQSRATDDTGYVQPTIAELVAVLELPHEWHQKLGGGS